MVLNSSQREKAMEMFLDGFLLVVLCVCVCVCVCIKHISNGFMH